MRFNIRGVAEFESEQAVGLSYPNDLMDGLYVDLDDKCMFLSAHIPYHRKLIKMIIEEDPNIMGCDMTDTQVDLSEAPHSYVVERMVDIVVRSAEWLCKDAVEL